MKRMILVGMGLLTLTACGVSQKQLADANQLLESVKGADCLTVQYTLNAVQRELQSKIK